MSAEERALGLAPLPVPRCSAAVGWRPASAVYGMALLGADIWSMLGEVDARSVQQDALCQKEGYLGVQCLLLLLCRSGVCPRRSVSHGYNTLVRCYKTCLLSHAELWLFGMYIVWRRWNRKYRMLIFSTLMCNTATFTFLSGG